MNQHVGNAKLALWDDSSFFARAEDASNSFSSHSKIAWTWRWDWTVWTSPPKLSRTVNVSRTKQGAAGGFQEFCSWKSSDWSLVVASDIATKPLPVAVQILTCPWSSFRSLRQLLAAAVLEAVRSNSVQACNDWQTLRTAEIRKSFWDLYWGHQTWLAENPPKLRVRDVVGPQFLRHF